MTWKEMGDCKQCGKPFGINYTCSKKLKFCSHLCYYNYRRNKEASYWAIHVWLRRNYGSANRCENEYCLKQSFRYEYALREGLKYERKRENFQMLCVKCHRKLDKVIGRRAPKDVGIETGKTQEIRDTLHNIRISIFGR